GGCYGGAPGGGTVIIIDKGKQVEKKKGTDEGNEEKKKKKGTDEGDEGSSVSSVTNSGQATIVVSLPASAQLSFNGHSVGATAATERTFVSPQLVGGQAYSYDVKAEFQKDGRTVSVSKRVRIEPGKTVRVNLNEAAGTSVAS